MVLRVRGRFKDGFYLPGGADAHDGDEEVREAAW